MRCLVSLRLGTLFLCLGRLMILALSPISVLHAQGGAKTENARLPTLNMLRNMIVEIPADAAKEATKPHEFRFSMLNIGSDKVDGRDCWKFAFIAGDQTPADSKKRFEILVDKEQGWPRKITAVKAESNAKIQKVGEALFIADGAESIPLDFVPWIPSTEFREGTATLKFQSNTIGKEIVAELLHLVEGQEKLRVRQRWMEGEDWWRYYDKHVDGVLVLRARRADTSPIADAFGKIEPILLAKERYPLREDKRLYSYVQIEPNRRSLADVFERIKAATGVDLETSANLSDHAPNLTGISMGPKGWQAWQMMEALAKIEIEDARWETTKTGYRLTGVSKVLPRNPVQPPVQQPVAADDQPAAAPGGLSRWLVTLAIAVIVLLAILVGAALVIRKWSETQGPNSEPDSRRTDPRKRKK